MKPAANTSCHESSRVEGVRVDPTLDSTSDDWKRRVHTRLLVRHVSLFSRAGRVRKQYVVRQKKK